MKAKSAAAGAKPKGQVALELVYKVEIEPASPVNAPAKGRQEAGRKPRYQVLKPALVPTRISREELDAAVQAVVHRSAA